MPVRDRTVGVFGLSQTNGGVWRTARLNVTSIQSTIASNVHVVSADSTDNPPISDPKGMSPQQSTSPPAGSCSRANGSDRRNPTRPADADDPVSANTSNGNATIESLEPGTETAWLARSNWELRFWRKASDRDSRASDPSDQSSTILRMITVESIPIVVSHSWEDRYDHRVMTSRERTPSR